MECKHEIWKLYTANGSKVMAKVNVFRNVGQRSVKVIDLSVIWKDFISWEYMPKLWCLHLLLLKNYGKG